MPIPAIRYTKVDGLSIAWQQFGSGPDVLVIPGLVSNIELMWEHEFYRRVLDLLGKHVRVTQFDKRGMGLSERTREHQTIEQRMADVLAVMEASGLERTHLLGISEGGLIAQIFAARYPERVDKMVIGNSLVAGRDPDPDRHHRDGSIRHIELLVEHWGQDGRAMANGFSPTQSSNEAFVRWLERLQRLSGTQHDVIQHIKDARLLMKEDPASLSNVVAPTLIMNSSRDQIVDPASGDRLHERIPNSDRFMLDSDNHFMWLGDQWEEVCSAIVEFFTGAPIVAATERRFGSVVFTDLVDSTAATAAVGDHAWSKTLQKHDAIAWRLADEHNGTIIKSTGDGLLVLFNLPHEAIAFCDEFRSTVAAEGLHIRAGIHCGEVELRPNGDITGFAVNLAARVEQAADDGAVWVSSTVRDMLMGGSCQFAGRGEHTLKGFDEPWRLYELAAT